MNQKDIDLDIALRKLEKIAYEEGDLGYAYWREIMNLIKKASEMQVEIEKLKQELEIFRTMK